MPFFENYGNDFMLYYRNHRFPSKEKSIPHIHPHYEMVIIPQHKSYEHITSARSYTINEPSVAIFSPFSMHQMNIAYGDCVERFVFYFGDEMIRDHPVEFKGFEEYQKHSFLWSPLSDDTVAKLRPFFDLLATAYSTEDVTTQKMLFLIVLNKILSLDKDQFITVSSANTGNINNVVRYMSNHFQENITAEDVAQHFFISRSKLNKDFKQHTGISFHSLLNELKLNKAKYLLQNDKMNIKDISSQVGFDSETYFFAFFKKMTGLTPLQYSKTQGYRFGNKPKHDRVEE